MSIDSSMVLLLRGKLVEREGVADLGEETVVHGRGLEEGVGLIVAAVGTAGYVLKH